MKIHIAISAIILAASAGVVWKIDDGLAAARSDERRFAAEAARLGISLGDAHLARSTKRKRVDRDEDEKARKLAVEYNTEAKKWESVVTLDDAAEERYRDIHQRIEALDSSRLKIFITDVFASKDLHELVRAERAVSLLGILAKKDPEGALALFKEHYAAIKICLSAESVISKSLGSWVKDDPTAAVEWMKKNAGEFPDGMIMRSREYVIRSAAEKDPRLAFSLIARLEVDASSVHSVMVHIVAVAKTDEERNVTLAALREYRDANQGDKGTSEAADRMFGYFTWGFKKEGFDAATKWIADANLSPKELERFCGELSLNYDGDEPVKWIEWMGATLPPGKGDEPIMDLVRCWTFRDYEAAGKWLSSAPEGPTKNAAIRSYALKVFPHDPDVAMQWIMTLPPGKDRDFTLKNIHLNWPKADPAGAAAFATEHGIEQPP